MRKPWDKPLSEDEQEDLNIRFFGDMLHIEPKPGDVFVLTTTQAIRNDIAERLKAQLSPMLNGAQVIVLGDGAKLECVAAKDLPEANQRALWHELNLKFAVR